MPTITIREFTESMVDAIAAFNERIAAQGCNLHFPTSPSIMWLPKLPGSKLFQEGYLAVDALGAVRGAYMLKRREFSLHGDIVPLGAFQLPISEGKSDRKYVAVGVQLLRDALQRQPALYALGMGGYEQMLPRLLGASGWKMFLVPFYFRVVHPLPFWRNIMYLRRSTWSRGLIDALALTGLGWATVKAVQAFHPDRTRREPVVTAEVIADFDDWADELWNAHHSEYGLCATRDLASLRTLYPKEKPQFIRLKISEEGRPIGWVVLLHTQLSGHKQFGNMRLGSLVDGFCAPADADRLIHCAREYLERDGADLIVSNQAHTAWCRGLRRSGFLRGPSNYIFASSSELIKLLCACGVGNADIHVTRGDGDGPIHL